MVLLRQCLLGGRVWLTERVKPIVNYCGACESYMLKKVVDFNRFDAKPWTYVLRSSRVERYTILLYTRNVDEAPL